MDEATLTTTLDSLWVIVSACLVFFMHAGFALVESGFCRKKNVVMVLLKNVAVVSIGSAVFYLVGYGLMFGEGNAFIGLSMFAPSGAEPNVDTLPIFVFLFFQLVFAATACTIVSGAIAERGALGAFFIFTALATVCIYPVTGHWVWGGGWLDAMGFHDFAGSTVVHAVGGGMALAGAVIIGPRLGKYRKDGTVKPLPAHSFPLATLGVFVLWLGWFGFNGGSTVAASPAADIAAIILVTNLAAAAGFLTALAHVKLRARTYDLSMALNGALAGLVGITAGADVIAPLPGLLVGAISAVIVVEGVFLLDKLKIDDPVGAISVHGFGGIFGTLAVGIFGSGEGLSLGAQAIGAFAGFGYATIAGGALWYALKLAVPGGVRVSEEHEIEGLDAAECGVHAYGEELDGTHPDPEESRGAGAALSEA